MSLTTNALAAEIGVTRATLWNWQRAGMLPAPHREGRTARYDPAAVAVARNLVRAPR
ncbi:MAG: MerR family transcriptional regulator [Sphingomonas sp.]|uniref:MerR family transcriptional regulator n=1 Tax=Sphingomonas sp. TaxID=28214 RepID=UPI0011F971C7|nr:MAG: MerR family transcriptional regulator [Sphingomonas sp.]